MCRQFSAACMLVCTLRSCRALLYEGLEIGVWARQVAWVRRRGVGRGLPRAHLQADLDIVSLPGSSPCETLLADAETIRTVSEVNPTEAPTQSLPGTFWIAAPGSIIERKPPVWEDQMVSMALAGCTEQGLGVCMHKGLHL